jgi:hypothetical protein
MFTRLTIVNRTALLFWMTSGDILLANVFLMDVNITLVIIEPLSELCVFRVIGDSFLMRHYLKTQG